LIVRQCGMGVEDCAQTPRCTTATQPRFTPVSHRKTLCSIVFDLGSIFWPYGPPLGIDGQAAYHPAELLDEPGDLLVLYSESLITALNKEDRDSGWQALDDVVQKAAPRGAEAVKSALFCHVEVLLLTEANPDEITLVIIERKQETVQTVTVTPPRSGHR
jgi:hypothetical protein